MGAGMLPSAYGVGDGGEFRAPMAIAVIGGLIVSTVLSLVFVPSFYVVMDDLGRLTGWIFGRFLGKADREAATEWGNKAAAAAKKADELTAAGDTAGADKFTNLTRVALQRQIQHEGEAKEAEPTIAAQNAQVEQLKSGLVTMKTKLEDLKARRSALVARARSAEAQSRVQEAIGSMDVMDPTSELGRFEERIRQQEALVTGRAEAQAATLEDQFAELEDHSQDAEIEARLAALRQQG